MKAKYWVYIILFIVGAMILGGLLLSITWILFKIAIGATVIFLIWGVSKLSRKYKSP